MAYKRVLFIVVIARNGEELQAMAEDLRRMNKNFGLSINFARTKVMTNIGGSFDIKMGRNHV